MTCEVIAVKADIQHCLVVNVVQLKILQHQCCLTHTTCTTDRDKTTVPVDVFDDVTYIVRLCYGDKTAASVD